MDNSGGKVIMLKEYRKLDACMYVHPGTKWAININPMFDRYAAFADQWKITFKGTVGHLAQAMEAANAQRAAILTMNAIDSLHIVPPIEHIITGRGLVDFREGEPYYFTRHGLCETAEMGVYIRQNSKENLDNAIKRMKECALGLSNATNTQVIFRKIAPTYESQITNVPLAKTFKKCFEELKVPIKEATPSINPGTSDFGNVSRVTPSTSASIKIGEGFRGHTPEFAEAAASEEGHKAAIIGAKAMALLTAKLFTEPNLVRDAKKYFNQLNSEM
jgi:metal-dependent amidase/aminoacylase/carboxypeptidase family protein